MIRREFDWSAIEEVITQRHTCIAPGLPNYIRAKQDFEQFNDRVRYYTFDLPHQEKGYARLFHYQPDHGLFLDFATPWGNRQHRLETLRDLVVFCNKEDNLVVQQEWLPGDLLLYSRLVSRYDLRPVVSGLRHCSWIRNIQDMAILFDHIPFESSNFKGQLLPQLR